MGTYDRVQERTGWGLPRPSDARRTADEVADLIELSRDPDPKARKVALANLCPCHVRADHPEVWDRVFEMVDDPDPVVRRAVVHMLGDGSPRYRAPEVAEVLERLRNDRDRVVRRQVRRVLQAYNRTGRINVL
ncbi:MAG TPA: HEAT repeat domain-containing protein [Acidimicrobiales bacterium]|nr:HEAT repeat domain-containing protein [Acidimicrobiales bacterium]